MPSPPGSEATDCGSPPCRGAPQTVGAFPVRRAPEASGLVASRRHPGALYVVDDGPGTTGLLVISARDARVRGRVEVTGLDGFDTEALAAGPCAGGAGQCIYVGDIGDNLEQRDFVTVYRFAEPPTLRAAVVEAERIALTYPDGPRDAEALLVDHTGTIAIVSKRPGRRGRGAARLYTTATFADGMLTDAGRVPVPRPRLPLLTTVVGNVVTGADSAPGRVVLRTYDTVFEYVTDDPSAPLNTFAQWPVHEVEAAAEPQGEAVAYGPKACAVFTVSEASGELNVVPCDV